VKRKVSRIDVQGGGRATWGQEVDTNDKTLDQQAGKGSKEQQTENSQLVEKSTDEKDAIRKGRRKKGHTFIRGKKRERTKNTPFCEVKAESKKPQRKGTIMKKTLPPT